jgi:hypothetical protein
MHPFQLLIRSKEICSKNAICLAIQVINAYSRPTTEADTRPAHIMEELLGLDA